jgi:small GTP-binding protein
MYKHIVLVGDSGCGKTALAVKLSANIFIDTYEPSSFENFQAEILTKKGKCDVSIMDTSGCHDDINLRALAYKDCSAIIVCFDLTDQSSLNSIEQTWLPELKKHCPKAPVYIAGCKRDALCEGDCKCGGDCCTQSEEDLLEMVQRTGAVAYTECSAAFSSGDGVEDLFRYVVESSLQKKKKGSNKIISSIKKTSKNIKKRLSIVM